jgi:post-segregation antitoxin (ccd killing protein)
MARPTKYSNTRRQTGITIDEETLRKAKEAGINISQACEVALQTLLRPEFINKKLEAERSQLDNLIGAISERERTTQKEKGDFIEEFKKLGGNVLTDEAKLLYWSKKTGLSPTELKALWRNEIGNAQHVSE